MAILELTTAARVKAYAEIGGKTWAAALDAFLAQVIVEVSAAIEAHVGRGLMLEARTQQYDLGRCQNVLWLRSWPVTTITSVKNDATREFGATTIVDAANYYADLVAGSIEWDGYAPVRGSGVVQVVYTAGLAATTAALVAAYPDIAKAAEIQCLYAIQRRASVGGSVQQGGGASAVFEAAYNILPVVEKLLHPYRRVLYG